jgi:hypothetical protein
MDDFDSFLPGALVVDSYGVNLNGIEITGKPSKMDSEEQSARLDIFYKKKFFC